MSAEEWRWRQHSEQGQTQNEGIMDLHLKNFVIFYEK